MVFHIAISFHFLELYKRLVTCNELDPFFISLAPILCGREAYKSLLEKYLSLCFMLLVTQLT